jgi:hypothetical protein
MDKKFVTIIIIITKKDWKNSFKHIYSVSGTLVATQGSCLNLNRLSNM